MAKLVRKAVFPVAGRGARFLPATKELLPVIDKPLVQYAVEEAVEAGIEQLIFITGRTKRAIEDHFDRNLELEASLEFRGKDDVADSIRSIVPEGVACIFVRQPRPEGLGDAVLRAEPAVGDEPFAVLLADDLMQDDPSPTSALIAAYRETGASILAYSPVARGELPNYGILAPSGAVHESSAIGISGLIEKPAPENAPSNLASLGRYVFAPGIFSELRKLPPGINGEVQLADAIDVLSRRERVMGLEFRGRRFDCGSKLGYLEAIIDFAIEHDEFGSGFVDLLKRRLAALNR